MKNNTKQVKKNEKGYLEQQTVVSLKAVLRYHKLPVSGSKPALIARLVEAGLDSPESKKMVGVMKPKDEPSLAPSFEEINGKPRMSIEDLYNPEYMIPRKQYPKEKPLFKLRGKSTPTPRAKLQAQLKPAIAEWYALKSASQELIDRKESRDLQKELRTRLVMRDRLGDIQNEDPEYLEEATTYMKKPSLLPSVAKRPTIVDSSARLGGDMYPHPSDPEEYDFYKDRIEPHVLLNNYIANFFRTYNNPNITETSLSSLTNDAKNIFDLLDLYESINGEPATITFELSTGEQLNVDTGGFFEAIDILRPFLS